MRGCGDAGMAGMAGMAGIPHRSRSWISTARSTPGILPAGSLICCENKLPARGWPVGMLGMGIGFDTAAVGPSSDVVGGTPIATLPGL